MKRLLAAFLSFLFVCAAALACSLQSFTKPEPTGPNFAVTVTHRGRPASGIEVTLAPENREPMSIGASDEKGRVKIRGLATGRYFLRAKYHGIETETRWIKVTNTPKKRNVRFELHWADYSIDTQEVSGMLTGLVTGNTGNKIMDLAHPREVVHPGVALSLKGAFAKDDYNVISDSSGSFVFGSVPPGTYLLTIAGGQAAFGGLIAEETIIVLDVSPSSRRKYLPLQLRQGGCGGIGYELKSD